MPKQVYGDLGSNGRINSLIHGIVPLFGFAVAFFFARSTTFALMIHKNAINVKHFLRKIAKNVKTDAILANVAFFVNVFLRKIVKSVEFTRKIAKMFKTGFILANVVFFVKVISRKKRCCYRSAGACPPRALKQNEKRPQPGGHGRLLLRPRHGEGQALALR